MFDFFKFSDDKENDNVPLIAGVTVGLLILVTVAISATVCVLRKRRYM